MTRGAGRRLSVVLGVLAVAVTAWGAPAQAAAQDVKVTVAFDKVTYHVGDTVHVTKTARNAGTTTVPDVFFELLPSAQFAVTSSDPGPFHPVDMGGLTSNPVVALGRGLAPGETVSMVLHGVVREGSASVVQSSVRVWTKPPRQDMVGIFYDRSELVSPANIASIDVSLFRDTNRDGVRQAGEPGIAGVRASLDQQGVNAYNQYTGQDGHVVLWGSVDTPSVVTVAGYGSRELTFTYGRVLVPFAVAG